ncbi:MAG: hypothetical protein ACKPGI_00210, partial [Verrucomicrobiota bacterium]
VFLTVWGFKSDGTLKNPQNTGGNALEPVVGIGRFNLMNWRKISDLLRKSTSLGKSPGPSTTRFTGQFTGQFHPPSLVLCRRALEGAGSIHET